MKKILVFLLIVCGFAGYGQRISELPAASALDSANLFVIVQSGVTKKIDYYIIQQGVVSIIDTNIWGKNGSYIYTKTTGDSVGIGTLIPLEKLDVNGNARFEDTVFVPGLQPLPAGEPYGRFLMQRRADSGIYWTSLQNVRDSTGWEYDGVDIRNTNAGDVYVDSNLRVGDNLYLSNTQSADSGIIYFSGGRFIHNYGSSNTFMGLGAGNFTLTGTGNSVFGNQAGMAITSGGGNTIIGSTAGYDLTEGDGNNLIGSGGGGSITEGNYNTTIGGLASLTTGDYNVAIGTAALRELTTTSDNAALGFNAGRNSTGTGSLFLGYQSGYDETTGTHLYLANGQDNGVYDNTWLYGDGSYNLYIPNGGLTIHAGVTMSGISNSSASNFVMCNGSKELSYYSYASWISDNDIVSNSGSNLDTQIAFFTSDDEISSDSDLTWDDATDELTIDSDDYDGIVTINYDYVGSLNASPTALVMYRPGLSYPSNSGYKIGFKMGKNASNYNRANINYIWDDDNSLSNYISFDFYGANGLMNLFADGTLAIGTTTNHAEKLYVDGTSYFSGALGAASINADVVTTDILVNTVGSISDNDATPDVGDYVIYKYQGTANSVTITDLDNIESGVKYTIIGNSDTYTITINDGGNFNLSANRTLGEDDVLVLFCLADNDYIEISFTDN